MVSRFRVKKLSPKHPLPVFKESQLPDLIDPANLQRSVPQIETGVEKEEEEEVCYSLLFVYIINFYPIKSAQLINNMCLIPLYSSLPPSSFPLVYTHL